MLVSKVRHQEGHPVVRIPILHYKGARDLSSTQGTMSLRCQTQDTELCHVDMEHFYTIVKILGKGAFGQVMLARCKRTDTAVALKCLPKESTKMKDFQREVGLSYYFSPHPCILDTYNVAFQTRDSFVFVTEQAPHGDLFDAIPPHIGLREWQAKHVIRQVASAVAFIHSKNLVHRDVKPENILLFNTDFTRVKLTDFGLTREEGIKLRRVEGSVPYTPPEIHDMARDESLVVMKSEDTWSVGILLYCILTGNFPWEKASDLDKNFYLFKAMQKRKLGRVPPQWRSFSPRLIKLFRKLLDLKPKKRCSISEIFKFLDDKWVITRKGSQETDDSSSSNSESDGTEIQSLDDEFHNPVRTGDNCEEKDLFVSRWVLNS